MYKILNTLNITISLPELLIKRNSIMKPRFVPCITCFTMFSLCSFVEFLSHIGKLWDYPLWGWGAWGLENEHGLVSGPDMGLMTISFLVWWKPCLLVDAAPASSLLLRWFPLHSHCPLFQDDDLEEGEVKDPSDRKVRPRPTCRFFMKGNCLSEGPLHGPFVWPWLFLGLWWRFSLVKCPGYVRVFLGQSTEYDSLWWQFQCETIFFYWSFHHFND